MHLRQLKLKQCKLGRNVDINLFSTLELETVKLSELSIEMCIFYTYPTEEIKTSETKGVKEFIAANRETQKSKADSTWTNMFIKMLEKNTSL
jgi:hypothetical protein